MTSLADWIIDHALDSPLVLLPIAFLAFVTTRFTRILTRRAIRHVALSGLRNGRGQTGQHQPGPSGQGGWWRPGASRIGGETGESRERRRRQRIDSASRMVNHLVALVVWIVATIVAFHVLDLDPAFFLSSAGFLGAGLAIGGQHKVSDYLTGLSVHFEDRYGVGDEIVADVGWDAPLHGVVDHVGLFSTRIRDAGSTVHVPNSALAAVRNLSQEAASSTLRVRVPDGAETEVAASTLRDLAGTDGLTDVVFVGDLTARRDSTGEVAVDVCTSRVLDDTKRDRLVARTERALGDTGW